MVFIVVVNSYLFAVFYRSLCDFISVFVCFVFVLFCFCFVFCDFFVLMSEGASRDKHGTNCFGE